MKINKKCGKKIGFFLKIFPTGKKAIGNTILVSLILTILSFGLLAITVSKAMSDGDDLALEIACKQSIDLRAATVMWAKNSWMEGKINLLPPLCSTIDKNIKGSRNEVMEEIADLSARCWWMFGEGRYEEILANNPERFAEMMGVNKLGNDCFICYTMLIDEKDFDGEEEITVFELLTFMGENNYPKLEGEISYLDYIQEYGGPGRFASLVHGESTTLSDFTDNEASIEAGSAYAMVYLAKNKKFSNDEQLSDAFTKFGAGEAIGAVGGLAAVGACIYLTAGICGVAIAVTAVTVTSLRISAINDVLTLFYGERDVSSIYIDDLRSAQAFCHEGDLGGK